MPLARPEREPPDPNAVANRLHSAAVHLLRSGRRTDEDTGLSPARLSLLSLLVFGGPTTISELAAQQQVSLPTISRLVTALEQEGLVERARDPSDKRRVLVAATREGASIMLQARRNRVEYLAQRLRQLDPGEVYLLGRSTEILERVFD